jgi:hypothetical protein
MKYLLKIFENNCLFTSDKIRIELIENFLKEVKNDPEYNIEEPDYDSLLDRSWDAYEWQTYIQNDLENNQIIHYEGWVAECWNAIIQKDGYKGLTKVEILDKFNKERLPLIANALGYKIISSDYFWYESIYDDNVEDGYISKIVFKIK